MRKSKWCIFYVTKSKLLIDLLNFLAGELGQALDDIGPGLVAIRERLEGSQDLVLTGSDLLGSVAVTQSDRVVLDGLEVNGDTEGSAQLVVTGVALADTGGRVVHTVGDTDLAQFGRQVLD